MKAGYMLPNPANPVVGWMNGSRFVIYGYSLIVSSILSEKDYA